MKKRPRDQRSAGGSSSPPDLSVLVDESGNLAVLSFALVQGRRSGLTSSESEVLRHLLAGRSNREIARERQTSMRTVEHQVAHIFRKLAVTSRLELVALAPLLLEAMPTKYL
jgi:DNA-binding NarL/FixJ family response regulator